MRVLAAALALLLLVAICSLAEADLRVSRHAALSRNDISTVCCFSYFPRPIPRSMIHSAYRSSPRCTKEAVVLVTRKGKQICADPKAPWVQKYLENMELLEQ
ncbi:CCL3 protein, partial [Leptocoma aspasia]|nr:CCL3 protein [Leptocoma aspasia]